MTQGVKIMQTRLRFLFLVFVLMLILAPSAHAYLDSGKGSSLVQIISAVCITCATFYRSIRKKVEELFKKNK